MHSLRPATTEDVPFLVDVVVEATRAQGRLPADFDEEDYRAGFADWTAEQIADPGSPSSTSVVALDGRPVGRLRVVRTETGIELAGLQLLPAAQSQGLGSRIIGELVSEAAESGRPLSLSVEADNPRAIALFRRLGFVELSRTDDDLTMVYRPVS